MRLPLAFRALPLVARAIVGPLLLAAAGRLAAQRPDSARAAGGDVAAAQPAAIALGPRLSLATVISRALTYSPTYASAEGVVRTSLSAQRVALGAYLPFVSASAIGARSNQGIASAATTPSRGIQQAQGAGIAASVSLFTGGLRRAVRHEAAAQTRAADAGLVLQRYAVRLVAEEGYLEVLRGHELVRVGEEAVSVASKGLSYALTMARAGTVTPADVLQARLALTTAQRQLLAARGTLQATAAMLGRLVGADGPVDAEPLAGVDPAPLPMPDSAIVAVAMRDAPVVQQAEAQVAVTTAAVRAAKAQYAPLVSATSGYSWSNDGHVAGAPRQGWIVSVGAALPLFTGFQREDSVVRADVARKVASVTAADTRRLSGAEARQLLGELRVAEQDVALTREAVRVATENLRITTVRYRAGIATILDQLTAQQFLIQAELDLVSARFTYQIARASLEALLGREL